ncbi:MAG: NAD-dependent epimerase/dehydratase family protein [Myxococcales bacterium]|nr:NAD-dependent epimerase/dehydratase family protein [Myxococcales bacterium]
METTLVTGATGLVGYNIVEALRKRGRKVRVLVRSLEKGRRLLPEDCEFVQGDITDKASIEAAMDGCDVVYHVAGFPEQWMKDPSIFERVNVGGTQNMIDVALEKKVRRFVYTSTIDVFAAKTGQTYDESQIDTQPKGTYYERSKQVADQRVVEALEKGLPAIFLHPSGVYGPGPTDSPGTNDLIVKLYRGEVPVLLPGGYPVVFAADVAEGHVLAEEKAAVGSRYILSEAYYAMPALVKVILEGLGLQKKVPPVMPLWIVKVLSVVGEWFAGILNKPPLIPKGQLHFMQWQAIPDSTKAQHDLGWKPTSFPEGIAQTIPTLLLSPPQKLVS